MNLNAELENISLRLKEERTALGMTQEAFSEIGEVSKRVQINYEKGSTFPDARYLLKLSLIGVDINYVITGKRSKSHLKDDEALLLELYKQSPTALKLAAIAVLESGQTTTSDRTIDNVGQYIEGDVNDQTIHGGFNFGNKKE